MSDKDYLTVREAAAYAGVSYSHWRAKVQPEFPPGVFFGRLTYRKADVQRYKELRTRWPQSTRAANGGISWQPTACMCRCASPADLYESTSCATSQGLGQPFVPAPSASAVQK